MYKYDNTNDNITNRSNKTRHLEPGEGGWQNHYSVLFFGQMLNFWGRSQQPEMKK